MSRFWKKKSKSMSDQSKENALDPQHTPSQETNQEETQSQPEETQIPVEGQAEEADIPVEQQDAEAQPAAEETEAKEEVQDLETAKEVIANLQVELHQARQEAQEAKSHAVRLQADFQNFRRRQEKEMASTIRFANEDLLKQLLPILDNFDRTLDAMEKTDNLSAIKEGIAMVDKSMKKQLNKIGLEPIPAKGKPFDSELHEAITTIPVEDEAQKDQVIDEVEKGYKLKDRVLRYAKVVIGE